MEGSVARGSDTLVNALAEDRADVARTRGQSKIHFSDTALEAGPADEDGPKTTRRPTASRRIPKQKEPELDPEQAAIYAQQQRAALAAAQLGSRAEPPQGRRSRVVMALFLGLALGAGGVFAYFRHVQSKAAAAPAPVVPDEIAPGDAPSAAPPPPEPAPLSKWVAGRVTIDPEDAELTVDGQPIASRAVLELRGDEGHSFRIELKRGVAHKQFEVMLTDRGPLPDTLSLDDPPPAPAPGPVTGRTTPPRIPPKPPVDDDIYE